MKYIFAPQELSAISIVNSDQVFPVRRVYCVGRNYAAHTKEMGGDADCEAPFFFTKPADAIVAASGIVPYPPQTKNLHHEVELIVALNGGGSNLPVESALSLVWGYGVGVDLTRRDLQDEAKNLRRPWDLSKGFDASGPCGPLYPVENVGHVSSGEIWLNVNGVRRQSGDVKEMIWSVGEIISEISKSVLLAAGDIIFTGTPSGVGPLDRGDLVSGGVSGIGEFSFLVG